MSDLRRRVGVSNGVSDPLASGTACRTLPPRRLSLQLPMCVLSGSPHAWLCCRPFAPAADGVAVGPARMFVLSGSNIWWCSGCAHAGGAEGDAAVTWLEQSWCIHAGRAAHRSARAPTLNHAAAVSSSTGAQAPAGPLAAAGGGSPTALLQRRVAAGLACLP